jgi:hypothetical protein
MGFPRYQKATYHGRVEAYITGGTSMIGNAMKI